MFGVIPGAAPPKHPGVSQFMSSATIIRMLGLFFGAICCALAEPGNKDRQQSAVNMTLNLII